MTERWLPVRKKRMDQQFPWEVLVMAGGLVVHLWGWRQWKRLNGR